ncbi:Dabb family protein [Methanothrix sp.]
MNSHYEQKPKSSGGQNNFKEIKYFELGVNIIPASNAYDLVLLSEFMSPEELVSYQKHPEHVRVAEVAGQVCESRIVVDYAC